MNEDQQQRYHRIIEQVLDEAKKRGMDQAEAALGVETGLSVSVRLGEIETLEYNHDRGLAITVYQNQRKGSANTSDLSEHAIRDAVDAACSLAKHTAMDEYAGLADAERLAWDYPDLDLNHPWDLSAEQAVELALACENSAREFDTRIINSEGATLNSHRGMRVYANSHGFFGHYPSTRHSLSCSVIGQDGGEMQRDYWYSSARDSQALDAPATVGEKAARRTVARLNGRRLSTRQVPVLYTPDVAAGLLGHYLRAISGGSLYRKTSFLLDSLGEQIFPTWLNLFEKPLLQGAIGSAPFDSEGVATQSRQLVENGIVNGYILSSYSARRLGMETTGNAGGIHNLIVETGDLDQQQLIRQMDRGLVVTELMGQGINMVTGDYSRGAAGFWVENGEIQYPVEEITVAGRLQDIYRGIVAIGNDVEKQRNVRTGSVLIEQMTVAGE